MRFLCLALRMLCIVGVEANLPEVSLEGLLTFCRVFLREERSLIGRDGREVLRTKRYCSSYRCEADTTRHLVRTRCGGTRYRTDTAQVQTGTNRVRGSALR